MLEKAVKGSKHTQIQALRTVVLLTLLAFFASCKKQKTPSDFGPKGILPSLPIHQMDTSLVEFLKNPKHGTYYLPKAVKFVGFHFDAYKTIYVTKSGDLYLSPIPNGKIWEKNVIRYVKKLPTFDDLKSLIGKKPTLKQVNSKLGTISDNTHHYLFSVDKNDVIETMGIRISKEKDGKLPKVIEFCYEPKFENGPRQVKWLNLENGREASFLLEGDDFPDLYKKIKDF